MKTASTVLIASTLALTVLAHRQAARNYPTDFAQKDFIHVARTQAKTDYIRPCYFTNWAHYRQGRGKYLPEDYVTGLCTHILFAFGWMNPDFTVRAYDDADLPSDWAGAGMYNRVNALKKTDPKLKTSLSIGGWTFGTQLFKEMSTTPERRKTFIDSAVAFARKWNFDGLDIDWEYPSGPDDVNNYSAFIKELREACDAEAKTSGKARLLVTAAVSAGKSTIKGGYNIATVAPYFDFILLMNYDFHGSWSSEIGFNSPLYSRQDMPEAEKVWNIDWAARYWNDQGMPKEKIIIGIPTYGRGWTMKDPTNHAVGTQGSPARITQFTQEAGVASYYELCEMLARGAKRYWHAEQQVPYLVDGDQWWSYDDVESISNKMAYIKREQYGGAFVWTLDFDDFNAKCSNSDGQLYPLIAVIAKELGGITIPKKTPPPTPIMPETPRPPVVPSQPGTLPPAPPHLQTTTTKASVTTTKTTTTASPINLEKLCDGQPDGFQSLKNNCKSFLLCLQGSPFVMSCPAGLHFATNKGYCILEKESTCEISSSTLAPTTRKAPGDKFQCVADGFFGDVNNCQKFIRCVNGVGYLFDCPLGLSFHDDSKMCDHPDQSKCAGLN